MPVKYAGKTAAEKIGELREKLSEHDADAIFINALDGIAWLYNIRANDVACTPVAVAYAYVSKDNAILFTNTKRVSEDVLRVLSENGITLRPYESVFEYAAGISKQLTVLCDEKEMNYSLYHTICGNEKLTICLADDPVKLMKSVKMRSRQRILMRHICRMVLQKRNFTAGCTRPWRKGKTITEYQASEKLYSFRQQRENFKGDSFTAILLTVTTLQ